MVTNLNDLIPCTFIKNADTSDIDFRLVAESMPQIVWVCDVEGRNIYFNKQWVDYTGLSFEDSHGHGWNKPFHPDDQKRAWDAWQNAVKNNGTYSLECRLRRSDGDYFWWLLRGVPCFDASGKISRWYGTCTHIEEIKMTELNLIRVQDDLSKKAEELAQAKDLLQNAYTNIESKVLERTVSLQKVKADLEKINEKLVQSISTRDELIAVISHEQQEAEQANETLRSSEQLVRLMIETVSDYAIYRLSPDGIIRSWNVGAERLKGYQADEIIGKHFSCFFSPEEIESGVPSSELAEAKEKGRLEVEGWRIRKDGSRFLADVVLTAIRDDAGVLLGFVKITKDISERRRLEQFRIAKEEAEAATLLKSRFLDTAAHELRTPVTAFSLLLQLSQKQLEKGRPVDVATLVRLRAQADRLARLVVDLLEVSRLERGTLNLKREPGELASLIRECLDNFALVAPLRKFHFTPPEVPIEIGMDRERIYQVLSNFIDNAIKYTPETTPIQVTVQDGPSFVRVSVEDQGAGVSDQQQRSMFKPFSRGASDQHEISGGLGLGLFICDGIIRLHGGTIGVTSKIGAGSTFYFGLPKDIASEKVA